MHSEHQVPIWFFIGAMLLIYGVLIVGAGVYGLSTPTEVQRQLQQSWPEAPWYFLHPGRVVGRRDDGLGTILLPPLQPVPPGRDVDRPAPATSGPPAGGRP